MLVGDQPIDLVGPNQAALLAGIRDQRGVLLSAGRSVHRVAQPPGLPFPSLTGCHARQTRGRYCPHFVYFGEIVSQSVEMYVKISESVMIGGWVQQ